MVMVMVGGLMMMMMSWTSPVKLSRCPVFIKAGCDRYKGWQRSYDNPALMRLELCNRLTIARGNTLSSTYLSSSSSSALRLARKIDGVWVTLDERHWCELWKIITSHYPCLSQRTTQYLLHSQHDQIRFLQWRKGLQSVLWLALYNTQTNINYLRFPVIFFCKIFNTNLFDGFKILDQIYRKLC